MKKGLLTLLAASLVFVGCQNYDDQFDDLNAQISALKSQVDGLSSLSGQVSALSGTIAGLQSGIAAAASSSDLSALSASLTALQADVDAVQASLATAATASAVAALQTELDALEADLDDLLTSNNVYATDITISDAASMAAATALGNKVALVNATVTITDSATVSDTELQAFIDRIKTMNGNFVYSSGSTTGYAPTFDQMVSAKAITLTVAGDISFKALTTATTIQINDDYESKITSVDFGALTSLTAFNDDGTTANKIYLTSATNVDLASLTRHTSTSSLPFTVHVKKGATLDISALDDVSTLGKQEDIYMELNGPASVSLTAFADGDIGLTNVATASVSNYFGTLDVGAGVETLTVVDGVNIDLVHSSDLETATLDFAIDYDPDLSSTDAATAAKGYSTTYMADYADGSINFADMESLTVTGQLLELYVDGTSLNSLSIDATMDDLEINGTTDLTSLTVSSDSKIGDITLTGTTNLVVADFNHTTNLVGDASTAMKSVSFVATNNTALEKLHSTGDDVDTLTITGNSVLAELDFTGLKDDGAETSAKAGAVNIYTNALVAASATNTKDADTATATTGAAGGSADAGSFDDGTSGMDTLKPYLTHIAATTGSVAFVTFDTLNQETDSEGSSDVVTLNITAAGDGSTTGKATVLKMTAAGADNSVADKQSIAGKKGYVSTATTTKIMFNIGGTTLPASIYTLTGNNAVDAANLASTANKDIATALGLTLNAYNKGNSYSTVSLINHDTAASVVTGERYTTSTALSDASTTTAGTTGLIFSTGLADTFTLKVGSNSVTVSIGGAYGGSGTTTTMAAIETALMSAWGITYGASGTASGSAVATLTGPADGLIDIIALQTDSGGHNLAVTFSANNDDSTTDSRTNANIDHVIGGTKDSGDNSTVATTTKAGLIVTLESIAKGTNLDATSGIVDASLGNSLTALATNYTANTTWTGGTSGNEYAGTQVERTDIVTAEDFVGGSANTAAAATLFNRVTWLG